MRIEHRIVWHPSDSEIVELTLLGFKLDMHSSLLIFVIEESDPRWSRAHEIIPDDATRLVYTYASDQECGAALWLTMYGTAPRGFPQPQESYMSVTYDGARHCMRCGCGQQQVAPFRFRGTPKLRSMRVLQFHWVQDEYFVTPDTWATVFEPFGIGCRPVVANHDSKPIDSIVQLVVPNDSTIQIDTSRLVRSECAACGHIKHRTPRREFWHGKVPGAGSGHLFRSASYFGTDTAAWRLTFVSQELYACIRQHKVRGCAFEPFVTRADAP